MEFIHYRDGSVRVQVGNDAYEVTVEEFAADLEAVGLHCEGGAEDIDEWWYGSGIGLLHFKDGAQVLMRPHCVECEMILQHFHDLRKARAKREDEAVAMNPSKRIERALAYLKSTDWMAIREREAGIPMPVMIAQTRKKAYALVPQNYQVSIPKTSLDAAQNNEEEHV